MESKYKEKLTFPLTITLTQHDIPAAYYDFREVPDAPLRSQLASVSRFEAN
jgi:hypothetical protein